MKLTQWFDGDVRPVRDGVYQREYGFGLFYCYWNGLNWFAGSKTPQQAFDAYRASAYAMTQDHQWRGVKK